MSIFSIFKKGVRHIWILAIICLMLLVPLPVMAESEKAPESAPPLKKAHTCDIDKKIDAKITGFKKAIEETLSICPTTKMDDGCLSCHTAPDWSLIEKAININRKFPIGPTMTVSKDGKIATILITGIVSAEVESFFEYSDWHPDIEKAVFEIHSPGGSLFEAWRIIGLMEYYKSRGLIIETRVHGFAASAGFIIFVNGTKDHRFASKTAELMWHELYSFSFFKVDRPSGLEDEAKVLRHLQNTASKYLAERSTLTIKQWDEKVHKKDFWISGDQAVQYGLSDGTP